MTDTNALAPDAGLPPIPLLANAYSLPDLIKASEHLEGLKTERGREENAANFAGKNAINQDVLDGLGAIALPPETVLREVEDASGAKVSAPVLESFADPHAQLDGYDADAAAAAAADNAAAMEAQREQARADDHAQDDAADPGADLGDEGEKPARRKRSSTSPTD